MKEGNLLHLPGPKFIRLKPFNIFTLNLLWILIFSVVYRNLLWLAIIVPNLKFGESLNLILLFLSNTKLAHIGSTKYETRILNRTIKLKIKITLFCFANTCKSVYFTVFLRNPESRFPRNVGLFT